MKSGKGTRIADRESAAGTTSAPAKKISIEEVLTDLRAGLRTKDFMIKYGISMTEFESILKSLIRKGLFTKDEFKAWKAHKPQADATEQPQRSTAEAPPAPRKNHGNVETYVIKDPEKNNSWALQLFSTRRERMPGAQFKVNLHGKKYAFVVERLLFRGAVKMVATQSSQKPGYPFRGVKLH
jgi:hypothetical protein